MVNATCSITIFNGILDRENRRTVYLPTCIDGVSWYESESVQGETGGFSGTGTVRIRIPIKAKVDGNKRFVHHTIFGRMSKEEAACCWTLRNEDIVLQGRFDDIGPIYDALVGLKQYGRPVQITSHADNTQLGSPAVHHWRIGGV